MVQEVSGTETNADYFIITLAKQVFLIGSVIILHLMAVNSASPTLFLLRVLFSELISVIVWPLGGCNRIFLHICNF